MLNKKSNTSGVSVRIPIDNKPTASGLVRQPYRYREVNPGSAMGQARNENRRERLAKKRTKKKTNQSTIGPIIL